MTSRRKLLIPTDSTFVFTYLHFNTSSFISLRDVGDHHSTRISILCKLKWCLTLDCHSVFLFCHTFTQTHYGCYSPFLCHFLLQYYIIVSNSLSLLFFILYLNFRKNTITCPKCFQKKWKKWGNLTLQVFVFSKIDVSP